MELLQVSTGRTKVESFLQPSRQATPAISVFHESNVYDY